MVYYNFSLFQSTIYLEENIEIITFFCYTAIVYIYAIQEVNVYLYIAVGKNFEKNSLFVLTRSGYVESCASGFLAGVELARRLKGQAPLDFPRETAIGALSLYVSNESVGVFQPMNINFGIIPPLDHRVKGKRNKNAELSARSLQIIDQMREEVLS